MHKIHRGSGAKRQARIISTLAKGSVCVALCPMDLLRGQAATQAIADLQGESRWLALAANPNALDGGEPLRIVAVSSAKRTVLIDPYTGASPKNRQLGDAIAALPLVAAYNAKALHKALWRTLGRAPRRWACVYLSEKLLASGRPWALDLNSIASRYEISALPDPNAGLQAMGQFASTLHALVGQQAERLKQDGLAATSKIEARAVAAIAEMECRGVPFDAEQWRALSASVLAERQAIADQLKNHLAQKAGKNLFGENTVDLQTDSALKRALEQAGYAVPNVRRQTLERLPQPLGAWLGRYRELGKLVSTYGSSFLEFVAADGRIHPTFEQIGASTGRMACHNPNLQAMVGDEAHRRCFSPSPSRRLVIADYSACELRILAEMSGDPVFLEAFAKGEDLHARVAQSLFGEPVSKSENAHLRHRAKAVNFGLVYGMGAAGLAKSINVSQGVAQKLLSKYFETFPKIKGFLESKAQEARQSGEARTLTGRRLVFEELTGDGGQIDRIGKNMPIQGTSADIIKIALARLHERLQGSKHAFLINAVHDEIVIECESGDAADIAALTKLEMEAAGAAWLSTVKLEVDVCVASHWQK